jgi:hypothetical protein
MIKRKKNAVAIGVSNLEWVNILLSYYPKDISENFDIYMFVDTKKVSIDQVKDVISNHNVPIFNNATFVDVVSLYDHYIDKHGYEGKAKEFLLTHGAMFKILMPIYLNEKYNVERTYTSDDDVFIFKDLSYLFTKYKGYAFKKENLFTLRNKDKYDTLAAFNEMFESEFTLEQMNSLSLNCGNLLYGIDPKLEYYFERFMKHSWSHHMYYDFEGYTSWTVEQRFHHFNIHRLMKEGHSVEPFIGEDLRLVLSIGKNPDKKSLKSKMPALLHYAVGKKKPTFLRSFLTGIEWRFGFKYEPKYELKGKLYCDTKKSLF